ncbi:MAG: ArsR family transcriptional regulator [Dehalococcoidia bacterium]|nr:ArsR family transcriptional regulator [Dehalococcoidia bacterium]
MRASDPPSRVARGRDPSMERTRDEVVQLLHRHGERSVTDLADAIGVSAGSIRRHMDIMAAEGLIETRLVRHGRGRPATVYSLTEAGEERVSAGHYHRLLDRLYPALAALPEEEVGGRDGQGVLDRVFGGLAESVAREHAPQVNAEGIGERVQQVTSALRLEGILSEAHDDGDVFRLSNACCPYRSCAQDNHAACDADRRTIELLLGRPVEQLATVATGAEVCEYIVHKDAPPTDRGAPVLDG